MGYLSRKPTSNDPPPKRQGKSPWLEETDIMDETALLLNGYARRCTKCRLAVRTKHLDDHERCPDCRPDGTPAA